ncbi:MAG: hypothetical protein M3Q95_11615 [Bacteroidota bacterium]|nr:hypothetical protein [Bacteroidota bacterium]
MLLTSCKDDKDEDPVPTNVLCDGKGSLSFMPLSLDNKWILTTPGNTVSLEVIDTLTDANIKYYNVSSSLGGAASYSQYPNGDVKRFEFSSGDDVLHVPFNPTVGQTWQYQVDNFTSRKVVGINETVVTGSCTYTGCVKIQSFQTTTLKRTEYFKRGVGLVSTDMIGAGIVTKLAAVTLN